MILIEYDFIIDEIKMHQRFCPLHYWNDIFFCFSHKNIMIDDVLVPCVPMLMSLASYVYVLKEIRGV